MKRKSITTAGALVCAASLAIPAGASADSFGEAVDQVQSHTRKADAALDRAERLLNRDRERQASRSYSTSRRELARAQRRAARLERRADSDRERALAAEAQELVADQQDENVEQLTGMLDEARGRVESRIAQAALSDAKGRDKSIAVITAILGEGVSSHAEQGLTRALSSLVQDRDEEVEELVEVLDSDDVSRGNQRRVARTVEQTVEGQATAASKLSELIASEDMPEQAKAGLQRALDAVSGEQQQSAETLSAFADRLPSFIRSFVVEIVERAQENARSMGEGRPAPPRGPEGGEQPGGTGETPSGQPEGTQGGRP